MAEPVVQLVVPAALVAPVAQRAEGLPGPADPLACGPGLRVGLPGRTVVRAQGVAPGASVALASPEGVGVATAKS